MAFVHATGHHPFHDTGDAFLDIGVSTHHHPFANSAMHDPANAAYYNSNMGPMPCDIKPRLTKEQHDILEAHYQKQNKPNTNTKKGFAEALNVSLDKVNNWFQNRRAKAKQDAKKQSGPYGFFTSRKSSTSHFSSDSDSSPSFASNDYFDMMQQCAPNEQVTNTMNMEHVQQQRFHNQSPQGLSYSDGSTSSEHASTAMRQHLSGNMFDSPQELNRRTLTQEQFDAFAHNGGMMDSPGHLDNLQNGISADNDLLQQMFPDIHLNDFKQENAFAFAPPATVLLPSNGSSVSSAVSEGSMFPSSTERQVYETSSTSSSNWGDSRSSSISLGPNQEALYTQTTPLAPPPAATIAPWQSGQSISSNPVELQQQFREVAGQPQQQPQQHEQPLAWPADQAYVRRESHGSTMLTQQMNSFAIQTPQPQQPATFKTPAPPGEPASSIAVRRQRPRPAALGLASLRSQSYSGAAQPGSPGQQPQNLVPGQQLRRIRSSNVINSVAQGRVMKSIPGSAQRSPLNWTFADALNSPKIARHASSDSLANLAPPTPMSPSEPHRPRFPPWQSSSGDFTRQASISETDAEHNEASMPTKAVPSKTSSSPPHTPRYYQQFYHHQQQSYMQQAQYFAPNRVGNNVITENTPPQSAPAAQQTFPNDIFVHVQQPPQASSQPQQQAPTFVPSQQHHFVVDSAPEQQFRAPPAAYVPAQHFSVPSTEGYADTPMHFAHGVPMVDAHGNLTLGFPPQMQQVQPMQSTQPMQFVQHTAPPAPTSQPPQHMYSPPQDSHYSFVTNSGPPNGTQVQHQTPKQSAQQTGEFFVHEYSPPQEIKRQVTQKRVTNDSGPKNYTFANQGPEHFERDKAKRAQEARSGTVSSSPTSGFSTS